MARVRISDVAAAAGVSTATVSLVLNDRTARIPDATARPGPARGRGGRLHPQLRGARPADPAHPHDRPDLRPDRDHAVRRPHARGRPGRRPGARLPGLPRGHGRGRRRWSARRSAPWPTSRSTRMIYACMWHRVVDVPASLPRGTVFLDCRPAERRLPGGRARRPRRRGRGGARSSSRPGTVGSPTWTSTSRTRPSPPACGTRATCEVLAEAGIEPDPALHVRGDTSSAGGRQATDRLLDLPEDRRPTALFCFNDRMAAGAYVAAHRRGLRDPPGPVDRRVRRPAARRRGARPPADHRRAAALRDGPVGDGGRPRHQDAGRPRRRPPHALPDRRSGLGGSAAGHSCERQPATDLTRNPQRPPSVAVER